MKLNKWILGLLVAGSLAACTNYDYNATNVFGEWNLTEMNGQEILVAENAAQPFIGFNSQEARIYGTSGCNNFFGSIVIDSTNVNSIAFDKVGSTKMACPDMSIEDELFGLLQEVRSIEYNADKLALKDTLGTVILSFDRKN